MENKRKKSEIAQIFVMDRRGKRSVQDKDLSGQRDTESAQSNEEKSERSETKAETCMGKREAIRSHINQKAIGNKV